MALRTEITELLSGFENRMKIINIVRCLLDYKYPDNIRIMIPNKKILDNIIVAVLLYIKDRTLSTEQDCTLADIEQFLSDISDIFPPEYGINSTLLARYIVVDVLQNGGNFNEFLTYNSITAKFENMAIRLVTENKGRYTLTDDALDFLFRSKEIESELDYTITRFKMQEYIKRDNYQEALEVSRELVSRIRSMKLKMDDFLIRCRENIASITEDSYDKIVSDFRNLMNDEDRELSTIRSTATERIMRLEEAQDSGLTNEEIWKRKVALRELMENISITITEQRAIINKKARVSKSYSELIQENFFVNRYERMNFEQDLLAPLRKLEDELGDVAKFLLFMFSPPELPKIFSIENFYAPHEPINEDISEEGYDLSNQEENKVDQTEIRNNRFSEVFIRLFLYMTNHQQFRLSEFIESLVIAELKEYMQDNVLPQIIMQLFNAQEVDVAGWKADQHMVLKPDGEFDLQWCLAQVPEEYLQMSKVRVYTADRVYSFSIRHEDYARKFDITDYEIEVIS